MDWIAIRVLLRDFATEQLRRKNSDKKSEEEHEKYQVEKARNVAQHKQLQRTLVKSE